MRVEKRPVELGDASYLLELYASTRRAEMDVVPWTEQQKTDFVQMQFTAQKTDYESRFPGALHSILYVDGRRVGRIWIDKRPDEVRLLDITIHPSEQNKGIGSAVIEDMQSKATTALRHSVYKVNQAARLFYERHGFAVIEDFEAYVLMEWKPKRV